MEKHKILLNVLLAWTVVSCCSNNSIKRELKSFQSARIEFPADMFSVKDRNVLEFQNPGRDNAFVVYHDSTECGMCAVIYDYLPLYERAERSGDFSVMIIFSPRDSEYDEIMERLVMMDFPYPVYVDYSGSFAETNMCIPEDNRFHSFLLDKEGHPVFVGNPLASDRMMELFKEALESLE